MKKQEKMEKAEKERKEKEEQQKATEEEIILNEKERLRLELDRMENSEESGDKNDETLVKIHTSEVEALDTAGENKESNVTEDTLADYV